MCELAADFLKSHQLRHFSHRQTLWTQLEEFTRTVHASLDPRATAYTIANEGRRLIECDRVSVAIRKGKKCKIEAISGQDLFDKRSNTVRLLGRLATSVVATGEAVWYTGETRDLAPQVEDAVQEYVDEAHSKTVAVLPLGRPAPPEEDDRSKREEPEPPIGALIVEQIEDSRVSASLVQRSGVVCQHSSAALANALEHQNLFLMPVWRALGKTRWVVQGRTLPKTLSIAGAVLLLLLVLVLWPARFSLEAKGTLEPVDRQDIFAGTDGVVESVEVAHKDMVAKNQLLVRLRNTDLEVAVRDVLGKQMAGKERLGMIERGLKESLHIEERTKLEGERAELNETLRALDEQLLLYRAKQLELNVRSPIAGQVLTFDLPDRLPIGRPLQRGNLLMRVADTSGSWQLELHMPENHIGHVAKAQQVLYDELRAKLRELQSEETRGKSPDMSAEDVDKTVDEALAKVPDEELRAKIDAIYQQRFRAALEAVRADVTDPALRANSTRCCTSRPTTPSWRSSISCWPSWRRRWRSRRRRPNRPPRRRDRKNRPPHRSRPSRRRRKRRNRRSSRPPSRWRRKHPCRRQSRSRPSRRSRSSRHNRRRRATTPCSPGSRPCRGTGPRTTGWTLPISWPPSRARPIMARSRRSPAAQRSAAKKATRC